jgi:maltose-binding protein MalE
LVLYYNKALVSPPPGDLTRFATPDDGRRSVVWNHSSMYYFWPFVLGQDGNPLQLNRMQIRNPGLAQALTEYVSEGKRLQLMEGAEGGNSFDSFVAGRAQSLIDGDWSLGALEERLGDDLGITELPKMNGVPLRSPCSAFVLAFPAQSLQGEKQVALKRLAEQLQSVEFQTAIWKTMRALPVNEQLIEAIRSSDDELLRGSLERFLAAEPLAKDARMQIVWEALKRGYDRYSAGFYDAAETTAYMQHLVEKSLRNPATPTP